jgi:Uncharacterized conserved protein (DUF2358)
MYPVTMQLTLEASSGTPFTQQSAHLWSLAVCSSIMLSTQSVFMMQAVRIFGRLFFTRCRLDVKRIWQPESNRISMRWQFHGVPRIPWEVEGIFDGVSQFKLDRCVCNLQPHPCCCSAWHHDLLQQHVQWVLDGCLLDHLPAF